MKTIFIMLSRGFVARNILRTDVLEKLKNRDDLKIVLFVPPKIPEYFRKEFNHPRIYFEECHDIEIGPFRRRIFNFILASLIYTDSSRFRFRYGNKNVKKRPHYIVFLFKHILISCISRIHILKKIFRFLNYYLYPDKDYDHFFIKYKPDLVFVAALMSKRDVAMLKAARRFKIKSIGMTRSWDNLGRLCTPFVPDKMIVQNKVMKDFAINIHKIPEKKVEVSGFPQFDLYFQPKTFYKREEFLKNLGLDPERKVIFFASAGFWSPKDYLFADIIYKNILAGNFNEPCSLLIRPHFSDVRNNKFKDFNGKEHIFVDSNYRWSNFFVDHWDPEKAEMVRFSNELKHSDVIISMASTICIEAAIFNKPVINIGFYLPEEISDKKGPQLIRWYNSTHYREVKKTNALTIVKNLEELRATINFYLSSPEEKSKERKLMAEKMTYNLDGKAGERVANILLSHL